MIPNDYHILYSLFLHEAFSYSPLPCHTIHETTQPHISFLGLFLSKENFIFLTVFFCHQFLHSTFLITLTKTGTFFITTCSIHFSVDTQFPLYFGYSTHDNLPYCFLRTLLDNTDNFVSNALLWSTFQQISITHTLAFIWPSSASALIILDSPSLKHYFECL